MPRLGNAIGDTGVKQLADMLKVNTTLTELAVDSECDLFVVCSSVFRCVADILNDCVYCGLDNQIGDNGVIDIAEALKVNSTLVDVSWTGTNISLFSFTSHPREQEL